jgi:hypothetical protein
MKRIFFRQYSSRGREALLIFEEVGQLALDPSESYQASQYNQSLIFC